MFLIFLKHDIFKLIQRYNHVKRNSSWQRSILHEFNLNKKKRQDYVMVSFVEKGLNEQSSNSWIDYSGSTSLEFPLAIVRY